MKYAIVVHGDYVTRPACWHGPNTTLGPNVVYFATEADAKRWIKKRIAIRHARGQMWADPGIYRIEEVP